ncbi:hypothetical protein VIOR103205_12925 [Vibrio ordalii]
MTSTFNPLGTDGFEFVEYTAADPAGIAQLKELFTSLGFAEIAKHRSKEAWLYCQGDINFIVNSQPHSQAAAFAKVHQCVGWRFAFMMHLSPCGMFWQMAGENTKHKLVQWN